MKSVLLSIIACLLVTVPALGQDINTIIQQGKQTGIFEFDRGTFTNFPMVELGTRTGFEFTGHGKSSHGTNLGALDGSTTRLVGGGFKGVISHFTFEKLTFVRQTIHIDSGPTIGSGNGGWDKCSFIDCTITFGNPAFNGNGADCWFRDCVFIRTKVGNKTSQNINYWFENCQINTCGPVFFQCDGGGNIHFEDCYVIDTGTLVQVTGPGHVFGGQNAWVTFNKIAYDAKHRNYLLPDGTTGKRRDTLVNDTNTWYGAGRVLVANNVRFSPSYPGILLRHTDKTSWTKHFSANQNLRAAR